jgi:hypothetical protein
VLIPTDLHTVKQIFAFTVYEALLAKRKPQLSVKRAAATRMRNYERERMRSCWSKSVRSAHVLVVMPHIAVCNCLAQSNGPQQYIDDQFSGLYVHSIHAADTGQAQTSNRATKNVKVHNLFLL